MPCQHISKLNLFPQSKGSQFLSGWVCKFAGQAFHKMHFLPPFDKSTIYNEKQVISTILTKVGRHFSRNLHISISYLQSTNFTAQKCNLQSTCFDPLWSTIYNENKGQIINMQIGLTPPPLSPNIWFIFRLQPNISLIL